MTILFFIAYFAVAISYLSVDIKVLCEIYHMVRRFGGGKFGELLVIHQSSIISQTILPNVKQEICQIFSPPVMPGSMLLIYSTLN